ncbi:MAG: hypothetical protein AABX59_02850 [Nanoarchaeota archaeon]
MKKSLYEIYVPELKAEVGNVLVSDPKAVIGRITNIDITSFTKGKNGSIKIKLVSSNGSRIDGSIIGIKFFPSHIRRFVRRGISKIEDSFVVSVGKEKLRMKPTLMTRKRVKGKVQKALRRETRDFLAKSLADSNPELVFNEIIGGDLQKKLSQKLKKVYPLSFCEIREARYEGKK